MGENRLWLLPTLTNVLAETPLDLFLLGSTDLNRAKRASIVAEVSRAVNLWEEGRSLSVRHLYLYLWGTAGIATGDIKVGDVAAMIVGLRNLSLPCPIDSFEADLKKVRERLAQRK